MYTITLRKGAAKEYLKAIAWYKERSLQAAENFVTAVNDTLAKIESDPKRYRNVYKQFHELKVRKYPYLVVYFIDDEWKRIVVTVIFHIRRHPAKKVRK